MLSPLANALVVKCREPGQLSELERRLKTSGEFAAVRQLTPRVLMAYQPLPGCGQPGRTQLNQRSLVFEGIDRVDQALRQSDALERLTAAPAGLVRLPGDFGFVHVTRDEALFACRACAGLAPVYYVRDADVCAISTRLSWLAWFTRREPKLDPLPSACWFGFEMSLPRGRSFVSGAQLLPPGHSLTLDWDRAETSAYWTPRVAHVVSDERTVHEHAAALREQLLDNIRRTTPTDGSTLLMLSGGVDSTSLLALSRGVLDRKLGTLSFLPPPSHRDRAYFQAHIDVVTQRYGTAFRETVDMTPQVFERSARDAPPVPFPQLNPTLAHHARLMRQHGYSVVMGGEFADELCGAPLSTPDWTRDIDKQLLLQRWRAGVLGPRELGRIVKHRVLVALGHPMCPWVRELPEMYHPELREEYRQWRREQVRELLNDPLPLSHLYRLSRRQEWVSMYWEGLSYLGLRRSTPFRSRELLELAFTTHAAERIVPETKQLLRRALNGMVPERNLYRVDKDAGGSYWMLQAQAQLPELPAAIEDMLDPRWLDRARHTGQASRHETLRLERLATMNRSLIREEARV